MTRSTKSLIKNSNDKTPLVSPECAALAIVRGNAEGVNRQRKKARMSGNCIRRPVGIDGTAVLDAFKAEPFGWPRAASLERLCAGSEDGVWPGLGKVSDGAEPGKGGLLRP